MKNAYPLFEPPTDWETTRRGLTGSIRDVCRELWGDRVTREDLGIVASARAIRLYDGQSYPVDVDSIKRLANKGIGIVIIEKSGIADVLAPFAEQYHIALVHTQRLCIGSMAYPSQPTSSAKAPMKNGRNKSTISNNGIFGTGRVVPNTSIIKYAKNIMAGINRMMNRHHLFLIPLR